MVDNKSRVPSNWKYRKSAGIEWFQGFIKRYPTAKLLKRKGKSFMATETFCVKCVEVIPKNEIGLFCLSCVRCMCKNCVLIYSNMCCDLL